MNAEPRNPATLASEIEMLRSVISSRFDIYDIRVTYDAVVFFVQCQTGTEEQAFDDIRKALVPRDYIPFLQKHAGEMTITVGKRRPLGNKGNVANIILLAVTLISTTVAGAFLWAGYYNENNIFTATNILNGIIFFVVPVMLILGTHEMGHYVVARKHHVSASLPFFIPSIPPIGTLGAFISIRDPFPSRRALLEIGIAGPIAGFLVSIPVAVVGFVLTQMNPVPVPVLPPGSDVFSVPFLYSLIISFFRFPASGNIFPTAFAAWVGFFATALNLLPAGQLDGGHVARALLGDKAKYLGWATVIMMVILSIYFVSWILMALFVLIFGFVHPPPLNDVTKLKVNRKMLGAVAAAMFLLTFTPFPVSSVPANYSFSMSAIPQSVSINSTTGTAHVTLILKNEGNTVENINITELSNEYFVALFGPGGNHSFANVRIPVNATVNVSVTIGPTTFATEPGTYQVGFIATEHGSKTAIVEVSYLN
ncbi:MAG: site-2 protease family protein [Methanomassiliicoccales archaeon]